MMSWHSALLIVLSTASPSPPPSRKFCPTEWNTTVKLELHDKHGDARLYHTLLPHGAHSAGKPSIVVLHGAFNNASVFSWSMLPFIEDSLSKGYVLIYAEGMVSIADSHVVECVVHTTLWGSRWPRSASVTFREDVYLVSPLLRSLRRPILRASYRRTNGRGTQGAAAAKRRWLGLTT